MQRLGFILHGLSYPVRRVIFMFMKKPRTRVWLTNQHGQILLVKGWFGNQKWSLPGGGIERGETAVEAAQRELREETGIRLPQAELTEYTQLRMPGALYDSLVFLAHVESDDLPPLEKGREMEIIGRMWVDPHDLPEDAGDLVRELSKTLMLADNA